MTQDFSGNLANKRVVLALILSLGMMFFSASIVDARSAYSPRHSGLEPPGGPRPLEAIPGKSPTRTPEGGMGYTDAYGNTVQERTPEEKRARQRLRPGAYGGNGQAQPARPLPDPQSQRSPVWNFQ